MSGEELTAEYALLSAKLDAIESTLRELKGISSVEGGSQVESETSIWNAWILLSAFNIMLMRLGFAMVETGLVAANHTSDVLIKTLCDACFGTIGWYLSGYRIYSGGAACCDDVRVFVDWIYSCSFATTATTILSGAIAGRANYLPYLVYSLIVCAVVYPVVAHWAWKGWLFEMGYIDFAGDGPVHVLGGVTSLVAAWTVGPRIGRFASSLTVLATSSQQTNNGETGIRIRPASEGMLVLGTFILWFGWYSFNTSSSYSTTSEGMVLSRTAAINTILAASSAGVVGFFWNLVSTNFLVVEVGFVCNSILIGLVAITAGCAYVHTYAAVIIGALAVPLFVAWSALLQRMEVDDPSDAASVHLGGGSAGLIFVGLFHKELGLFYSGSFHLLGYEVVGLVVTCAWAFVWASMYWGILGFIRFGDSARHAGGPFGDFPKWMKGRVSGPFCVSRWRMSEEDELCGMGYKVDVMARQNSLGGQGGGEELDRNSIVMHNKVEMAKKRIRASHQQQGRRNSNNHILQPTSAKRKGSNPGEGIGETNGSTNNGCPNAIPPNSVLPLEDRTCVGPPIVATTNPPQNE